MRTTRLFWQSLMLSIASTQAFAIEMRVVAAGDEGTIRYTVNNAPGGVGPLESVQITPVPPPGFGIVDVTDCGPFSILGGQSKTCVINYRVLANAESTDQPVAFVLDFSATSVDVLPDPEFLDTQVKFLITSSPTVKLDIQGVTPPGAEPVVLSTAIAGAAGDRGIVGLEKLDALASDPDPGLSLARVLENGAPKFTATFSPPTLETVPYCMDARKEPDPACDSLVDGARYAFEVRDGAGNVTSASFLGS